MCTSTSVLPQWLPGVVELFEPGKNAAAGAVQWEQLECQQGAGGCWLLGIYRVFSKGRNAVCPSKSLIFWSFPDVLGFFLPFNMGDFSFWYFWDI